MSNDAENKPLAKLPAPQEPDPEEPETSTGPSLKLMYGLLVAALLFAIFFALAIVRPFYLRR